MNNFIHYKQFIKLLRKLKIINQNDKVSPAVKDGYLVKVREIKKDKGEIQLDNNRNE